MHNICVKISVRNLGENKRDTQTASSLSFADKPWKGTPHVLEKFENFPSPGMRLCYNTSFSNFHSIICQVVAYGKLKSKENSKLLALKVVAVACER